VLGRNTQGVRLIRLDEGERLMGVERVELLDGGGVVEADAGSGDEPQPPAAPDT
jgi:DNA gyrase subunit A